MCMVKVLKFRALVCLPKGQVKQCRHRSDCFSRSSLIIFPVCYFDKHFVTSSPDNQHFFLRTEREKCLNFFNTYVRVDLSFCTHEMRPREVFMHIGFHCHRAKKSTSPSRDLYRIHKAVEGGRILDSVTFTLYELLISDQSSTVNEIHTHYYISNLI